MQILITRPTDANTLTIRRVNKIGAIPVVCPLLRFRSLMVELPEADGLQAIAFTSTRAIDALKMSGHLSDFLEVPVFAVGDITARHASQNGFVDVTSAGGNGFDLAKVIYDNCRPSNLTILHPAGEEHCDILINQLKSLDFNLKTIAVYRMECLAQLPVDIVNQIHDGQIDGALFYSARTAQTFSKCLERVDLTFRAGALNYYCLSSKVAMALGSIAVKVQIARNPTECDLLDLVRDDINRIE